jgi:hypothetical protein
MLGMDRTTRRITAFAASVGVCALAVAALGVSSPFAASSSHLAARETAPECLAKLRQLVAALAKLDRLAGDVRDGKAYLYYDYKAFYPIDKVEAQLYVASLVTIKGGNAQDIAKTEQVLVGHSQQAAKKLDSEIARGHELVQARERRCNNLTSAGGGGSTAPSYSLVANPIDVSNPYGNLKIDTQARTAHVDQGSVTWDEDWTLPATITPGQDSSVTLGLNVTNNGPKPDPGQYTVGIKVEAPGFTKQYLLDISSQLSGHQTYTWNIPDSITGDDVTIVIVPYESSSVTYHYRK